MTVITISREHGSAGDEVAHRVCELLGCQYFDRRAVEEAVAQHLPPPPAGQKAAARERSLLDLLLGGDDIVREAMEARAAAEGASGMEGAAPEEEQHILMMRHAIEEAYERGNVVIVGRAGQVYLQDRPGVLHVRIEAPLDQRIARIQAQEGVDAQEAEDHIDQRDRAAADLIRTSFGVEWDDPLLYHFVFNMGKWSVEDAARLIVDAAARVARPAQP